MPWTQTELDALKRAFAGGTLRVTYDGKTVEYGSADDLLKLGMSLTALNQKADACKSYARLQHDFPSPPQSIKDRLTAEKQRAGCGG